jgi:hypothetical protein
MRLRIRVPLRHPFYPDRVPTPARSAKGYCAALSGSFPELAQAAASGVRAGRAIFALQYPDSPFITEYEREVLWQTFQVPVFAMLLDREGRLAAWECEAQDGMHIGGSWHPESIWVYRLLSCAAMLEATPCDCGRPGQRLRPAPRIIVPRPRSQVAAGANAPAML